MHFLVTQINYTRHDCQVNDCAVDVPVVTIHMESKHITELLVHNISIHQLYMVAQHLFDIMITIIMIFQNRKHCIRITNKHKLQNS